MPSKRKTRVRPPAQSPEAAERRCIEAAYDLAQRQLDEGTASPSVITHFLKMGTARAQLERDKLAGETELLKTKNIAIQKDDELRDLMTKAMESMQRYRGHFGNDDDEDDDYD